MIQLYFAPLEGITTHIYRKVHARLFGGCDAYFAPFIVPSETERVTTKRIKDILPENNQGVPLFVQVLTDSAAAFCAFSEKVQTLGYDTLNLNLGCPAATVVAKGRGAAQLRNPDAVDRLLDGIFAKTKIQVSVKTRLGFSQSAEFEDILPVFNCYPLSLLLLHPRTREQFYGGIPDIEAFSSAYTASENALCYNGDIVSLADFTRITAQFPQLSAIMIGRGAVQNPAIFREIRGGAPLSADELYAFTHALSEEYRAAGLDETQTLYKLKEIWTYAVRNFPDAGRQAKAMQKAKTLSVFLTVAASLPPLY